MWSCICCEAQFATPEAQRAHHSSEWHRYNLVRRVNALPPATLRDFETRAERLRQQTEERAGPPRRLECEPCRKTFTSENSYNNHVNSKRHKQLQQQKEQQKEEQDAGEDAVPPKDTPAIAKPRIQDEDDDDSDASSFEEVTDIFANDCLFCAHHSRTVTKNLAHMALAHSFFVPDAEYCSDLRGFLEYLGEKVGQGRMCLWCNDTGRAFQTVEAAQAHMRDKGHCKALHEGEALAEYSDFYDYSSSYPDHEEGDEDMEVETEESLLDVTKDSDEEYELVLPSGATIGHRSLLRYYKQNLRSHSGALVRKNEDKLKKVIFQYRALGWAPQQSDAIAKKAKDIKYIRKAQMKWSMQLGVKANKLQKHFRVQCNF